MRLQRFDQFLDLYVQASNVNGFPSTGDLRAFVEKLEKKKESARNDVDFLKVLFGRTHARFLREYDDYAPFAALFTNGHYNCLTASALYGLLLERLGFDYRIMETNYHVFLLVSASGGEVLFETTDPRDGFVGDRQLIDEHIREYRTAGTQGSDKDPRSYEFKFNLYNSIGLSELTGLLYFNLAVDAFNHQKFDEAIGLLNSASLYYNSERIKEFSNVILLAVPHSDPEARAKQSYLRKAQRPTSL